MTESSHASSSAAALARPDDGGEANGLRRDWPGWMRCIEHHPSVDAILRQLASSRLAYASLGGGTGSAASILTAVLARRRAHGSLVIHVTAHLDDADEVVEELQGLGLDAERFPALEVLPGETRISPELLGERLARIRTLIDLADGGTGRVDGDGNSNDNGTGPLILVAPIPALMQVIPQRDRLDDLCITIRRGEERSPGSILEWLDAAGYTRVDSIEEPGEFAVRGGLLDIYPAGGGEDSVYPVRLDFFDDEIESIAEIDLDTMASDRKVESVQIVGASITTLMDDRLTTGLWDVMPDDTLVVLHELLEVTEQGRGYYERVTQGGGIYGPPEVFKQLQRFAYVQADHHAVGATDAEATFAFPFEPLPSFPDDAKTAVADLVHLADTHEVHVLCLADAEHERCGELVTEAAAELKPPPIVHREVRYLHRGFVFRPTDDDPDGSGPLAIVPYHELMHRFDTPLGRRRVRRLRGGRAMDTFLDISPGDYVVHRDHGIARFVEIRTMDLRPETLSSETRKKEKKGSAPIQEYLTLEFAKGAKLHVPASKIDLIQKYVGGFDGRPPLSSMGGKKWASQKEKVREAVQDLASEMLRVQAAREHMPGIRYPHDTTWQMQFEAEFPYQETDDQLAALSSIKKDMHDPTPMDRLVCGDVGFGKTEVAIRAAFKAAEYGKQVAVLVPTTVLAEQHYRTFKSRFADYPFRVEVISRFQTGKEAKAIVEALKQGRVDIIIGTHRILSKDVKFADLGLVIIDEEQRFGVEHKQRLLQFRMTADVLTLSATPIPRTLHMSMLGLRDISSLTTAPLDRRAIVTEVIPFNRQRIKTVIQRELAREGQVFFVHNRVHNIQTMADDIQQLVPDARIVVGHGQMPTRDLEKVMLKFVRHEADILVCTTIIESGIDIPNANTMIINSANMFGLAELHQLRGRVGRYKHRAYCYMLLPADKSLSQVAVKRLKAIEEYSMLGAGFKIAMRDLEIRGAGNILGAEQSGHIAAVGYEMYCHLLEQTVLDMKNETRVSPIDTTVELDMTGAIPKAYIPSDQRRLEAYRRISQCRTVEALEKVNADLVDAYGPLPKATDTLLAIAEIRIKAAIMRVKSITREESDIVFRTHHPTLVQEALAESPGSVRVVEPRYPNHPKEIYFRPRRRYLERKSLLTFLRHRLG